MPPQITSKDRGLEATSCPDGLVDEMLAYYIDWRHDAGAVAAAYQQWSGAPAREQARCFSTYMAALDREQATAMAYARVVREVEHALERP